MSSAAVHAKSTLTETVAIRRFCSFYIGQHLYGIDIMEVKEINGEGNFTAIFHAPPQVKGYVNIRGQIHLVVDPRLPLGFAADSTTAGKMLLIFKQSVCESAAMLVDRIGDIVEVSEDRIEPADDPAAAELSQGVCKLDGKLMILLNPCGFFRFAH